MPKKSFDLGGGKNNIPSINRIAEANAKAAYNLQFIPYDKFYVNELNKDFSQIQIEELSASIQTWGLFHNLVAVKDTEKDMYRIISGERRWRAIGLIPPEIRKEIFPGGIPTKIENQNMDEVDEEIRLREANTERPYTDAEYRDNIIRLIELYKIKQKKGETPNLAKVIAEKTKLTERQIQKYINTDRLIPELEELFKNNKISLNYADKFSSLPEDAQKYIYSLYESGNTKTINEDYTILKKNVEEQRNENKRLHEELKKTQEELEEKEDTISKLNTQIESVQNIPYPKETQEDIIKELSEAKDKAEKEQKKLKTRLENFEEQQKDLKKRNILLSNEEMNKYSLIAKVENSLTQIEDQMKLLKNNKSSILSDETLKNRVSILVTRLQNLLE